MLDYTGRPEDWQWNKFTFEPEFTLRTKHNTDFFHIILTKEWETSLSNITNWDLEVLYSYLYKLAAAAKLLQSCLTLWDPIDSSPTRLPSPWYSPGKNSGVGCHFLLQCMKVKSESEVAQSCLTLSHPMDCSLPGCSIHGIFPGKSTRVDCHCLLHRWVLYNL